MSDEGFGDWAIENLGHLPVEVLRADVERRRKKGAGEGAIVRAWKACPPSSTPSSAAPPPRQSDLDVIRFYPDPVVVGRWLPKARAEGANIPAIVAAFVKEHPDALSSPAPHG